MVFKFILKQCKKLMKIKTPPCRKKAIPKALREQVWLKEYGDTFTNKCLVHWCSNEVSPFNFHVGHNIPESQGGLTTIDNLFPICSKCNLSMSNNYTIDEWSNAFV
jgi:5-methylcytosine-specific restriction endonuclease McrA